MKTKLLRLGFILVLIFIFLFSGLTILLNSVPGLGWLLTKVLSMSPGELHVGKIQGSFYKTLVLTDLSYHTQAQPSLLISLR